MKRCFIMLVVSLMTLSVHAMPENLIVVLLYHRSIVMGKAIEIKSPGIYTVPKYEPVTGKDNWFELNMDLKGRRVDKWDEVKNGYPLPSESDLDGMSAAAANWNITTNLPSIKILKFDTHRWRVLIKYMANKEGRTAAQVRADLKAIRP